MQVLVYSPVISPRLRYTCQFIFAELMATQLCLTDDTGQFKKEAGPKINYSNHPVCDDELHISPVNLLFEQGISPQTIDCFEVNNNTAFFKTSQPGFPFDVFAASFYLLSRYEEYLPHKKDSYGRYAHQNSLAFRQGFLQLPLVNIWVKALHQALQKKYSAFAAAGQQFTFTPTYDIDIAYSYRHKGFVRNLGGFLRSPSLQRIKVLLGITKDPFDTYALLDDLHNKFALKPVYFFLVAAKNGVYDKNILPHKKALRQLVKQHAQKYTVGIHPSWQSGDKLLLLPQEKEQLQAMSGIAVVDSRQHYIRFNLPGGYQKLIEQGIKADYSMGYGSINGFRASVAAPFFWFDLEKNEATTLRLYPFCYMDANSFYEEKLTGAAAFEELMHYYSVCKEVNGMFLTIWHNHFFGTHKLYQGWRGLYEKFLAAISPGN